MMNVVVRLTKLLCPYNYYEAGKYFSPCDILPVNFGGSFLDETVV